MYNSAGRTVPGIALRLIMLKSGCLGIAWTTTPNWLLASAANPNHALALLLV